MRSRLVAFFVLAAVAGSAAAQSSVAGQTTSAAKPDKGDAAKVTCRSFDTTGSRLQKKKICRTAAQWAEQNSLDRQDLDRQQANRWKNQ